MSFWKWLRLAGMVGLTVVVICGFLLATFAAPDPSSSQVFVQPVNGGKTGL